MRETYPKHPMDIETPQPASENQTSFPVQVPRSPLNTIFHNDQGLRAGWRIVMYIAMVLIFSTAMNFALDKIFHLPKTNSPAPWQIFLQEFLLFVLVFLPACFMAWLERRSVGDYGLPFHVLFGTRFWQGCALGVVEVVMLMGCIAVFGGYSFGSLDLHGSGIFKWGLFWALLFAVVGLFEEFAFRGYLQFTLADGIGFWPAAWILSLGFGAVHLGNKGEGWVGAAGVAMIAHRRHRRPRGQRLQLRHYGRGSALYSQSLSSSQNLVLADVGSPSFRLALFDSSR